jgi:YegS/Rv2252/BmrU family lipid kinase
MATSFYFIVNPEAGGGKKLSWLSSISSFFASRGLKFETVLTKAPKHATELARKAAEKYEVVVAVGGDGTVNEVGNGLIDTQAALGIIPAGSGNDFSKELGYSKNTKKDLQQLISGQVAYTDVGLLNDKVYFFNAFGVGFDGEVAAHARAFLKYGRGFAGYLLSVLSTLSSYHFHRVRITIDSHEPIDKEIFFVAVANGSTYGGGFNVAPGAEINDGFFNICIVDKTSKLYALRQIPKFMKGKHVNLPIVHILTGKNISISADDFLQAQIDGELPARSKSFFIKVLPKKLKIIRP